MSLVSMTPLQRLFTRAVVVSVVAGAAVAGCSSSSSTSRSTAVPHGACKVQQRPTQRSAPAPAPTVPDRAYTGAYALTGLGTQQDYIQSMHTLENQLCQRLAVAHVYLRWNYPFPTDAAEAFAQQGKSVLVSWTGTDTARMASGSEDAAILATARQIAALPAPVFLEFRWEMDRPNLRATVHDAATYIAAWDRVRRLFASAGAPNVSWVWCPTAAGFRTGTAPAYYPGDDQVDWVCSDVYAQPAPGVPAYQPFQRLIRPFLNWSKLHPKPIMIGEFGVPRSYPTHQRVLWFNQAREVLTASPRIKAVLYFDNDPPRSPPTRRFAIGTDPVVLKAFRALMAAV
jgi:hypothetical protein